MNLISPFHLEEIASQLILHLHRDTLEQFYLRYPLYYQLLNSARVLKKLQKAHGLSGVFTCFTDFIIEYDLNDPVRREESLLSYNELVLYASKTDNDELFQYAVGRGGEISSRVTKELGKQADPKLLESLHKLRPGYNRVSLVIGLFAGGHHDLFTGAMMECRHKSRIMRKLARCGETELVKKYYEPTLRDRVIAGAASENQLEILKWLGVEEDHRARICGMIMYALRNGDLRSIGLSPETAAKYHAHSDAFLVESIKGERIESVNWVLNTYKTSMPEYRAIYMAIVLNQLSIVKHLLLKNPSHMEIGLKRAAILGRVQVIDWILESQMIEKGQIKFLINSLYISKGENRCGIRYLKLKMS
ncbi:Hypothetical protein POVR1_LOCUS224 [uncultured virus]|nr:Hypothetical protein POVR1_LOCUS224 [uncultured virus]